MHLTEYELLCLSVRPSGVAGSIVTRAPHEGGDGPIYAGTCRGRYADADAAAQDSGRAPAWRFAMPAGEREVTDRVTGARRWSPATELGDFVIWKRDDTKKKLFL